MIGPLGRLGAAATLGQHCPQMTQRRCNKMKFKFPAPKVHWLTRLIPTNGVVTVLLWKLQPDWSKGSDQFASCPLPSNQVSAWSFLVSLSLYATNVENSLYYPRVASLAFYYWPVHLYLAGGKNWTTFQCFKNEFTETYESICLQILAIKHKTWKSDGL